ncbi:helix-turn-helix domain-containing protein [Acinetobacter cumulans]|uniref:helix-turn-helix domain-containing protein n=1 Tax=Acinetobacter cumulans TaxID=2136182 RepID=UPI00144430B2|nr:helix-turn-helix transcriptional regulator [Acinetobacter cumulans]
MGKICTTDIVNGYVINQIRLEAGYKKQGELGEKFGMSHAAIGKIERGESSVSLDFLTILAEMVGTRASKVVAVIEDINDYLIEHDTVFMSQTTYNILHDMVKDSEDDENKNKLILPTTIEDHISLELKKAVRNLVTKKPDLDVTEVKEKIAYATSTFIKPSDIAQSTGMAVGLAAAMVNPLLGIGIGASLLATKLIKNKKAP